MATKVERPCTTCGEDTPHPSGYCLWCRCYSKAPGWDGVYCQQPDGHAGPCTGSYSGYANGIDFIWNA